MSYPFKKQKTDEDFMTDQNPTHMTNAQGHLVPIGMVSPRDRLEDELVRSLIEKAEALNKALVEFRTHAFCESAAFIDMVARDYNARLGGKKGNTTLTSYDGTLRVQLAVADTFVFGPELQVAKALIDECIKDWSTGSNDNIVAIVDHAFRVDKQNKVNVGAILGLRKLAITDDKWQRAMAAIGDSMRVTATKQYIRFHKRPAPNAEFAQICLDIASA